ncbi:MAG: DUF748 domain-containing protein [Desulfobacterota bacterium]|nr:DUF748 domain-containing protein [Thermodesulfobacteriota bacterium]
MKKWLILTGLLLVLLAGAYFGLSSHAVKALQPQLQKAFGQGVTIGQIRAKGTFLSVYGLQWKNLPSDPPFLKVEEMRVYPSPFALLKRDAPFRKIVLIKPALTVFRTREGHWVGPWGRKREGVVAHRGGEDIEKKEGSGKDGSFLTGLIRIERGCLEIEDRGLGEVSQRILLYDVDADLRPTGYPSTRSSVELKGRGGIGGPGGEISIKGWIDLSTSEMDLAVTLREIELKCFEPYYRKRVSSEIDSGRLSGAIRIAVHGGMLDLNGGLELVGLKFRRKEGTFFYIPTKTLQDRLEAKGGRLALPFKLRADLKDPQLHLQTLLLWQIGLALAEALGFPVKKMEGVDLPRIN